MLGLMGLQIAEAAAGLAAGAADHLMQQLKGALGGARIAVAEAEIGVDHADQIEHRKMMALGDHLRADDDVEPARATSANSSRRRSTVHEIARQHQNARRGNSSCTSSSSRSTPGPMAANEFAAWQFGHSAGCGMAKPQWWQTSRLRKR